MNHNNAENTQHCPCGTGKTYSDCCGTFITNQKTPATPEELMRSRYTAYTQANVDYIARTMKSPAADGFDANSAREWAKKINWIKLEVVKTTHNSTKGIVEFRAYYSAEGKKNVLHEISEFTFEEGQWYYVDGTQPNTHTTKKIGRNDVCPCGSGKKYKKCCGGS